MCLWPDVDPTRQRSIASSESAQFLFCAAPSNAAGAALLVISEIDRLFEALRPAAEQRYRDAEQREETTRLENDRHTDAMSRMPTERWMPNPKERWVRGRARSMMNS
jgi:hypothetical protein